MGQPKTKDKEGKKLTVQRLNDMGFAYKQAGTLIAAIELNLFTHVSEGGAQPNEIANKMGIPAESVDRLMMACAALGLLEKGDNGYMNAPDVEKYLVKTRHTYFGDYLVYQTKSEYDMWKDLASLLKPPKRTYDAIAYDPEKAREFTVAGYEAAISSAHKLAKEFDFSRYSLWLDLGGGSGAFSIAAALRHPKLKAIVFDFPNVVTVAEEFIAKAGVSDRVKTQPGNFVTDEFPRGADLISYITPLQSYEKDEVKFLLKKAFDAINPGGGIIVIDYMLNDDKTGPLDPIFHHLTGATPNHPGRVNSGAEFCEYLGEAGFVDMEVSDFITNVTGRVTAKKPE